MPKLGNDLPSSSCPNAVELSQRCLLCFLVIVNDIIYYFGLFYFFIVDIEVVGASSVGSSFGEIIDQINIKSISFGVDY